MFSTMLKAGLGRAHLLRPAAAEVANRAIATTAVNANWTIPDRLKVITP